MKLHQFALAFAVASVTPAAAGPSYSYSWSHPPPSPPTPPRSPAVEVTPSPTNAPTAPPTAAPTSTPTSSPTEEVLQIENKEDASFGNILDCSLESTEPIQLQDNLIMRQVVNQQDNSVTVQMILEEEAWIGFAFSPSGLMVENTAVIGIPGEGVGLYNLGARSLNGVTLLPESEQERLSDASIIQEDGETVLTFTLAVGADGDALATGGEASRIIYAYGSGNTLAFHRFRSSAEVVFDNCGEVPAIVELDCSLESTEPIQLQDNLIMRQIVNQQDDSVTIQIILEEEAWIGFAFSPSGLMVENTAVIGLPGDGVGLYNLGGRSLAGVTLLPESEQQRLSDVSIVQEGGETVLTFTLTVGGDGEVFATGGEASRIIYAYGSGNALGFHKFRASTEIVFGNCADISEQTEEEEPLTAAQDEEIPANGGLDCSLTLSEPIQLEDKLIMRQVVNQQDNSVTVQMILQEEAWIGFAFSSNGQMIGTTSVIGIPGDGVGLYHLGARVLAGVTLLPQEEQERLSDVSIVQGAGETVLTFTLAVGSDGQELARTNGEATRIIYAWGIDNVPAYHAHRSSAEIVFSNCVEI